MVTLLALAIALMVARPSAAAPARSGAVATEHSLAAAAGAEMLSAGGNAIDAALAAAAAVCVVHASSCGIGGGGFALVHLADGRDLALDYRESAPALATPERYRRDGRPEPALAQRGGLAVGVPGRGRGPHRAPAGASAAYRSASSSARPSAWRATASGWATLRTSAARSSAPRLSWRPTRAAVDLPRRAREAPRRRVRRAPARSRRHPRGGGGGRIRRLLPGAASRRDRRRGPQPAAACSARTTSPAIVRAGGVRSSAGSEAIGRSPFRRRARAASCSRSLGLLANDDLAALGAGTRDHAAPAGRGDGPGLRGPRPLVRRPRLHHRARRRAPRRAPARRAPRADLAGPDCDAANGARARCRHRARLGRRRRGQRRRHHDDDQHRLRRRHPRPGHRNHPEQRDGRLRARPRRGERLRPGGQRRERPRARESARSRACRRRSSSKAGVRSSWSAAPAARPSSRARCRWPSASPPSAGTLREAVDAPRIHDQAVAPVLAVEPGIAPEVRAQLERIGHKIRVVPALGAVSAAGLDANWQPTAAGDPRKDGGAAVVP